MAIAEVDADGVVADESDLERCDVVGHGRRIEERSTGHFIDTVGALTCEPQVASGIRPKVVFVPRDDDVPLAAVNPLGDRARDHATSWASSSNSTFPLNALDTGQFALAPSAAVTNPA
jgi:hypothetical protein